MFHTHHIEDVELVQLGLVRIKGQPRLLWLHHLSQSLDDVRRTLTAAGFEFRTYSSHGVTLSGWSRDIALDTTAITVHSDTNPLDSYTVRLDRSGKALVCSCIASQHGNPCKHLYRAEVKHTGSLTKAIQASVHSEQAFPSNQEAWVEFNAARLLVPSLNVLIALWIRRYLGTDHPHATLAPTPVGPHKAMAKLLNHNFDTYPKEIKHLLTTTTTSV